MDDRPRFDLQSHSSYSDGALPPAEVVRAAAAAGVELLALTDHDTVEGVPEALAAAEAARTRLIPGVEISARDPVGRRDLHVLGYLIDPGSPDLRAGLEASRGARARRAAGIIAALRKLGFAIEDSEVRVRTGCGRAIGRPHIAAAVLSDPGNVRRLADAGIEGSSAFFKAYLVPGAPAFVPRRSPSVPEALAMIHDAGGVAVWAHPFWDVEDADEVLATIDRMGRDGLDGVECFYPTHTREQAERLADHCARRSLLSTGSADFHGPDHPQFAAFRAFSAYGRDPALGRIAAG